MKKQAFVLGMAAALAASLSHAYEAGDVIVRAGATYIDPDASGSVAGFEADVDSNTQLGLTASYMLGQQLGLELLVSSPFKHTVSLAGVGDAVETRHLPPTLSAVFYLMDGRAFLPYVGLGVNYTKFFDSQGTATTGLNQADIHLKNSWGLTAQLGADFLLNPDFHINASLRYIDLETEVKVDGVRLPGTVNIDPLVFTLAVGYKF